MMRQAETSQRGVAMIVALLMTATLSFLALSISGAMRISAKRSALAADRAELYWRAVSAEALAWTAIRELEAAGRNGGSAARLLPTSPLFLAPVDVPLQDGTATLQFFDAGLCFNVNSLAAAGLDGEQGEGRRGGEEPPRGGDGPASATDQGDDDGESEIVDPAREFVALATTLGLSEAGAEGLAAVALDWIDPDGETSIGGAEDDFYTSLPSPFRTGGGLLADVSELRAMSGFDRITYQGIRPFLCALPDAGAAVLNVNMIGPQHLPLLAAMIEAAGESGVDPAELASALDVRPPDGWADAGEFWKAPALAELKVPEATRQGRIATTSRFLKARAVIERGGARVVVDMTFRGSEGGGYQLVSRTIGEAG